jgi:hypothetical protein
MSRAYASRTAVRRDLQPGEKEIYIFRHHGIFLVGPIATVLGAVMAGVGASIVTDSRFTIAIVWLLAGLLICNQVLIFINWCSDFFVVTSERIIFSTSPVANQTITIELSSALNVNLQSSWQGYLLGYGSLTIKVPGEGEYNVNYIKYPQHLYSQLNELIQNARNRRI